MMDNDKKDLETCAITVTDANLAAGQIDEVQIDPDLERRTLAKFDKYLLPQLFVILILAYLDRSNIGNAKVFGFEAGIGLKGNQFNVVSTVFYPAYIVFEVPWTMAVKRYGPKNILGIAMSAWSITTMCTGFIRNYHQALGLRILLGFFEAGLVPCIVFIISTIWSRESQSKRVAIIYGSNCLSGAFGGLIAYAIESMGTKSGLPSWRWLFILEGAVSVVLCGICWLLLPGTVEDAWFLNTEEKETMWARRRRDIAYKGTEEFSWSYARMAFTDPFVYVASLSFFCSSIALFGFGTFLPTIIKGLGYTSKEANYLTIPVYIFAAAVLVTATFLSDRIRKRGAVLILLPVPVIAGYIIVCSTANHAAGYVAMFLCGSGIYSYNCIILAWVSNNLSPDYKRSVGVPFFVSLANISGVVSSNIYPASDGPRYVTGNAISAGMETLALCGVIVLWCMLKSRNAEKQMLKAQGVEHNGKEGDRALDFVYNL